MGLFSPQISPKEMVPLCRQLATSYDAGIPITRAVELVAGNTRDARAKEVLTSIGARLRQGETLGEAAREQQKYLPQFFVELLHSGEYGGKLDVMLRDIAEYYEDRVAMNRTIWQAMSYPMFLITIAWFLGSFALMIVREIKFDERVRFDIWEFIGRYLTFQGYAVGVFVVGFVLMVALSRFGVPQHIWGFVSTKLWPLKNVTRKFALARFFRSMSLLITSGVDIKRCIVSAADVTANPYIRRDLLQAVPIVAQGGTLTQAFSMSNSLTPVAREMLHIGEQTGNLDGCLRKVSEYHFAEARHAVAVAVKLLNAGVMLAVGIVIGAVIISFYAKLFSVYDSIQ